MGCNTFLAMSGHCYGEEQPGLVNRCYSSSVATVIEYSPHLQGRQSQVTAQFKVTQATTGSYELAAQLLASFV